MDTMTQLEERVRRIEVGMEMFARIFGSAFGMEAPKASHVEATASGGRLVLLPQLTVKQHVALQMIMAGKSNAEIAARFGVTENGAKVYVRAIAKKWGVHTRSQIIMAVHEEWMGVSPAQYEALTGGIPKDWAKVWLDKPKAIDPWLAAYAAE